MLRGTWVEEREDLTSVLQMREQIWKRKVEDEMDEWSRHLIIDEDGVPIAVGTVTENLHHRFRFCYLGVVESRRGQRIGDFLIRILITDSWEKGAVALELTSAADTAGFFMKEGFLEVSRENDDCIEMVREIAY